MKTSPKANVWLFFASVYGVSALLFAPILLSGEGMSSPVNTALMAMVTFVPSGMGVLFVRLTRSPLERRDFWRRVFHWPRSKTKAAIAGILILPVNVFVSFWIASNLSGEPVSLSYAARVLTDWKTLLTFLFVELTFGAVSEELGWRGYALDELQSRWSALASSLVLGIVWAFWHTPAFLIPGTSQHAMGGLFSWTYVCFLVSVTLGSIIHTWAYNNTGKSTLVAGILMHFAQNAALIFLGGIFDEFVFPPAYWLILLVVTAVVAGTLVLVYGPQTLRRQKGSLFG
jgi:membrane protease YdiL (CAAX protease family)